MSIIDPLVTHFNPHPKALTCPFTPELLRAKEHTPTHYLSIVFTFGLLVGSIKEFKGASIYILIIQHVTTKPTKVL
jgi:hypothetical protein